MASSVFPRALRVAGCGLLALLLGLWSAAGGTHWPTASLVFAQIGSANIYSDTADAKAEIRAALATAAREHKRVILDFGGNWCVDCQLLNIYFHDPGNAGLLQTNYVLVDISVGEYDRNLDLARKYGIPLNKGVPALVVLDGQGRVLYAQRNGEFEKMSKLDSAAVTAFLEKWAPKTHASFRSKGASPQQRR
ncbi:MAG: thioredoxin family protein [Acidobacteriaceae bacterium]